MSGDSIFVLGNPAAGRGRGVRVLPEVVAALGARDVGQGATSQPGDEARLVNEAVAQGYRTIVAVGGDGTWGNVANAVLRAGAEVTLGFVPAGTGSDFGKSLGIPRDDVAACARIIRAGRRRSIDVGRVEDRYFLNICGFGYDVAVLESSWKVRWLKGDLLYLYCALWQIYSYQGTPVVIAADGGAPEKQRLLMLIVANARVFGGKFRIAPQAELDDGLLDGVAFGDVGLGARLGLIGGLLRGTHLDHPRVAASRASRYELRFPNPPAYETDGEWQQAKTADLEVRSIPKALTVLAPAESP